MYLHWIVFLATMAKFREMKRRGSFIINMIEAAIKEKSKDCFDYEGFEWESFTEECSLLFPIIAIYKARRRLGKIMC